MLTAMRSINLLEDWLKNRGFTSQKISLGFPEKSDFLLISKDDKDSALMFSAKRISFPQTTSATRDITSDKTKTYDLANHFNISHPSTIVINAKDYEIKPAISFLEKCNSIVVKPYNGLQSRGVSLDVSDEDTLRQAISEAGKLSDSVILQKQFEGQEIRFTVIDNKVRSALLRKKPEVVGDGKSTVAQLIDFENNLRTKITSSLVTYPKLEGKLISSKIDLSSVPKTGELVEISKATMIRNGASVYEVLNEVDASYIAIAEKICSPLISSLVCVDLMIKDFKKPADENNYNLIELNLGMSLPLCYSARDGRNFTIIENYLGPKVLKEFEKLE